MTEAILTVLFGAIAGGVTNSIAIWMLFHPYAPPRILGFRLGWLQGAVPKNKARLAAAIGRTVGTQLLTPEDLARTVTEPEFRRAFDERFTAFLEDALHAERGALGAMLQEPAASELRDLLAETAEGLLGRLDAYIAGPDFEARVRRWAENFAAEIGSRPLAELLTPEREEALVAAAERWYIEVVGGPGFERAVRDYLDRVAERVLRPDRTFEALIPVGLVAALEHAIGEYLPLALERLGTLLEDPGARRRAESVLHEILDRFLRDLKFHQRIVAALIIPADTVDRVIRAIEEEGATKIAEVLHDPAVRDAMARSVNDAVVDFLRRPVTAVLGRPGDDSVVQARETIVNWMVSLARDPQTSEFARERLRATLHAAENRTWSDLFRRIEPGYLADALIAAARSDRARALYRETADRLIALILERPVGRLADHLPPDAATRLERALGNSLWNWLQEQVPALARRIDVARRVEAKIMEYPTERLEALIRGVTQRELTLIVRLGYMLGGLIGAILVAVNATVG